MKSVASIIRDLETRDLLELAKAIARKHHVTLEELLGRRRRAPEIAARHELWQRLYEQIPSQPKLGEIFGRDHSTIQAALHKYDTFLQPVELAAAPDTTFPSSCSATDATPCADGSAGPSLKKCVSAPMWALARWSAS
jgi:hypothetical protein